MFLRHDDIRVKCIAFQLGLSYPPVFNGNRSVRHFGQFRVVRDDDKGLVHLVAKAEEKFV